MPPELETITVQIDGSAVEVVKAADHTALSDRFTSTQGELTQWQQGKKVFEKTPDATPAVAPNPLSLAPTPKPAAIAIATFEAEFITDGALSADSRKKLNDAGYADDVINTHMGAKASQATTDMELLHKAAGGDAPALEALKAWAVTNLTDAQKAAYEAVVQTGNAVAMASHLEALASLKAAKDGTPPPNQLQTGKIAPTGVVAPYASQTEYANERSDKRYTADADFRKLVDHRAFLTPAAVLGWRE